MADNGAGQLPPLRASRLAAVLEAHLVAVSERGYTKIMSGGIESMAVVAAMISLLRADAAAWIPDASRLTSIVCARVGRFFAACLLDDPLPDAPERAWLRNLHALYVDHVLADGPAIFHTIDAPAARSKPEHRLAHRLIDAPPHIPDVSVDRALALAERAYRAEAAQPSPTPIRGADIASRVFTSLADDAHLMRSGDIDGTTHARYAGAFIGEVALLRRLYGMVAALEDERSASGQRLLAFMVGDNHDAPVLGRPAAAMLGTLGRLASDLADTLAEEDIEDQSAMGTFVAADSIGAHFRALSLDAASLNAGGVIAETMLHLSPPEPPILSFRFAATILDPAVGSGARTSFMMRSLVVSDVLSGHADLAETTDDRTALLCAARHVELRAIGSYWFPRQMSSLA